MNGIRKNIIYQLAYRILTIITPLLTSPYLSRILGAEQLGIFSATYAFANYFILTSMLGVELYGSRAVALVADDKGERGKTFWNIYTVQMISSVLSLLFYYFLIYRVFPPERSNVCILQGLWVIASAIDINWYFFGKQQFKLTVIRNTFIKVATILCIFVFVRKSDDLIIYVLIMSGGMLCSQIVLWFFLFHDIGFSKPDLKVVIHNVKPMVVLFIPLMASSVFHIMDKSMVDALSDEANSGYYYNVDRLVNIPLGLVTGIGTVMLPRISRMVGTKSSRSMYDSLSKSAELTIWLTCATAFGLGSIAKEFVPVFFGELFNPCVNMIIAFVPILLFKASSNFCNLQFLVPTKKEHIYTVAVFGGAVVNLIANYFLISKFNALGAVFGTFAAEGVLLIIELYMTRKNHISRLLFSHWFYLIAGLVMFISVRVSAMVFNLHGAFGVMVEIAIGLIIYALVCLVRWKNASSVFNPYYTTITTVFKTHKN